MMLRIAWRSLFTRPVRAAVLAGGFGFGIAVMAELLGVGQVILEQAHAPALQGGGDLVMSGGFGAVESARFIMSSVLGKPDLARSIAAVSPSKKGRIFLIARDGPVAVSARGGIPSLERAIGDAEISTVASWSDAPGDARWSRPDAGDVLRAMDRFHPVAEVPKWTSSWAEWLYFNGRTRDGRLRVYLTFLVGPRASTSGKRVAGVRLQLERDGRPTTYSARGEIDEGSLLAGAPDLEIAGNRVRLEGLTYRITLALTGLAGEIVLDAVARALAAARHDSRRAVAGYRATSYRCSRARCGPRFRSDANRSLSKTRSAITITTGDSGKAFGGNGARSRRTTCRSCTVASFRRPTSPTPPAFQGFWRCSAAMAPSGFQPT